MSREGLCVDHLHTLTHSVFHTQQVIRISHAEVIRISHAAMIRVSHTTVIRVSHAAVTSVSHPAVIRVSHAPVIRVTCTCDQGFTRRERGGGRENVGRNSGP